MTGINALGLICNLLDACVDGMFFKAVSLDELYQKLRLILRGGRYITAQFVQSFDSQKQATQLTERES